MYSINNYTNSLAFETMTGESAEAKSSLMWFMTLPFYLLFALSVLNVIEISIEISAWLIHGSKRVSVMKISSDFSAIEMS